ncbi:hypothetical protein ACJMK2_016233 [Sinanodonta woodiana]|uniref:Uncharacterized protein n=1 Tax=Sinanodonta woodiana TaxID=1069815 RepID=A0ABD3UT04_SINWO
MADKEGLLESPEFQNFTSVQLAFKETAKELHEYVDKKLKIIHEEVYTRCSIYEQCQQYCSEKKKETHNWCDACTEWKRNLSRYIRPRGRRVYWDKMRSWEWPQNHRQLGRVFASQCWEEEKLNDLPTYLEIIKSCSEFKLPSTVLNQMKGIREARNKYTGHNPSLQISENIKNSILDMIKRFASTAELSREINSTSLLQTLHDIQTGKPFQRSPEEFSQVKNKDVNKHDTNSVENDSNELEIIMDDLKTKQNGTAIVRNEVKGRNKAALAGIFAFIFACLTFLSLFTSTGKVSHEGCLGENFLYPLPPDIYLFHYIKERANISGREWLLQNISDTVFDKQFDSTGVLLVAEMGFGKSALVSHIVCAETKKPGGKLRARLLAYHVCRFDALNTKGAATFIRRLAGMIANSIPQFGSALQTEKGVLSYLNSAKCNSDPVGCMDQSIVYTLSKVESSIDPGQTWIIAIDALDECEDTDANTNEILSVLERTAYRFPKWIKFLCTSRNISVLIRKLRDFRFMEISANDVRNKRDIYDFVRKHIEADQSMYQTLSSTFTMHNISDIVDKLCAMSSGNFLYVHHALEYLKSMNNLSVENIPDSLEKIYQLNFERIYGQTEERFHWARKVLEILCVSNEPMKKENIFDILHFESLNLSKNTFTKVMNNLMHFVSITSDEKISFAHISMYHWLTDVKREAMTYYIEKEVGHNVMARYLFHLINESNNYIGLHIINLAVHVSESKQHELVSYFKSLPRRFFKGKDESGSLLHALAKHINSYRATELCLYFFKNVDILNENKLTSAFIAAGRGHVETLKALLDSGAKITFRISLPTILATVDDAALITKTRTFWEYGLLDIAAQHGHVDTVRLLLSRKKSMANVVNYMNMKPHHLACEFGHANVLEIFLGLSPRFADHRCLYNAASGGHTQIIERLLNLGVKDICLPCTGFMYWLKENESRMQSPFLNFQTSIQNIDLDKDIMKHVNEKVLKRKPFDDWQTVSCETALHASSRLGFIDTVRLLISNAQNATRCLYNAASGGHTQIVKRLLNVGVKDVCLPCNGSFYWLKENENRMQSPLLNANSSNKYNLEYVHETLSKRKPFDDWRTISCETALHVSSRLGLTDIVRLLIYREQNSLQCRDRAERTPFLTALIHNRTDIVELLYPFINASDKCLEWNLTQEEIIHLNGIEKSKLTERKCSYGSSVVHLIARYGLTNMANNDLFRDMDWEEEDMEGCRPIHHAACHAGLDMLVYLYGRKVDFYSRTKNGSTAFHMAALCRPFNLYVMYLLNSKQMPPLFDNLNRSILHYMYMQPLSMDSNHALNSISERQYLIERIFNEEDIMHVDLTGANIMHYIMKNGYFDAIPYLYNKYQDMFFTFIIQNDSLQNRPLDKAFYTLPYDERIVRRPYNCSMNEVIALTCDGVDLNDYVMYMSPIELTIFFFVITVSPKIKYNRYFKHYVHEAIKRSNVYVTLMFLIYFDAHSTLGTDGLNPLTTFTSTGNNPFMADLFLGDGCDCLKCGVPIQKSPLHQISLNMNNSFWFVDCNKVNIMIRDLSTKYIEQCVDNEGFNVLHRAVEGGNYELVKCYFDRGLSLKKNSESVLQYVLLGAMAKYPFPTFNAKPYELLFFIKTKYLYGQFWLPQVRADYDKTTLLLLRHIHNSRFSMHDVICQNTKATLSPVHLAAANGLLESLKYIANKWGKNALLCQNADLMSPIYLAYAFNHSRVIRYLEERNITLNFPKHKPELYSSFILLFDVNKLHQRTRHCLRTVLQCVNIINYSPHNYFVLLRGSSCLKKFSCSDLFMKLGHYFMKAQKIMAQLVRLFLSTLYIKDLSKSIGNNNCIIAASGQCVLEFPKIRASLSTIPILLKNLFSVEVMMETLLQNSTVLTMKWLFDRWNVLVQYVNMTNHSVIKYFETVSSVIEPALGREFAYLRILTLIGRYNQLKTARTMFKNISNETNVQLYFKLPQLMMDAFKPLNDLFISKKHKN